MFNMSTPTVKTNKALIPKATSCSIFLRKCIGPLAEKKLKISEPSGDSPLVVNPFSTGNQSDWMPLDIQAEEDDFDQDHAIDR